MAKPKKEEEKERKWKPNPNEEEITDDLHIWNPVAGGKAGNELIGDELIGEVIALEEGMYGIEAKIEEVLSHMILTTPAHRILQTALAKLNVGDRVRITYVGVYTTKNGQTAQNYKVARRK